MRRRLSPEISFPSHSQLPYFLPYFISVCTSLEILPVLYVFGTPTYLITLRVAVFFAKNTSPTLVQNSLRHVIRVGHFKGDESSPVIFFAFAILFSILFRLNRKLLVHHAPLIPVNLPSPFIQSYYNGTEYAPSFDLRNISLLT